MKNIESIKIEYLASDIEDAHNINWFDKGWKSRILRLSKNKPYLYNRTRTYYTDGSELIGKPIKIKHKYTGRFDRLILFFKRLSR